MMIRNDGLLIVDFIEWVRETIQVLEEGQLVFMVLYHTWCIYTIILLNILKICLDQDQILQLS